MRHVFHNSHWLVRCMLRTPMWLTPGLGLETTRVGTDTVNWSAFRWYGLRAWWQYITR